MAEILGKFVHDSSHILKISMHVSRPRVLCVSSGVFGTLRDVNPSFMHNIFNIKSSIYSPRNPDDLQH